MNNQFKKIPLILSAVCLFGFSVKAQKIESIRYSVSIDAGVPVGIFSDNYKWTLGGSIQADIPVSRNLYVTANAGYNNFFAEDRTIVGGKLEDVRLIPVKAGLKYFPLKSFYVQGEAGVSFVTNKSVWADKTAVFVYSPQIGYLASLGRNNFIDAGIRFESNSKFYNGGDSNNFLALRLAYAFPIGK